MKHKYLLTKLSTLFTIVLFLITVIMSHEVYAVSAQSIETYKPIYFIAGDKENQVKYQVSFKYNLWEKSGLYLSYTQLSKWDLYDQSSPFRETNYNPSIFWEKENLWKLDLLRISPYSHLSNGRDGQESRGTDRGFVESQISYGDIINIGIREKAGWFYSVSNKNHDIKRYIGYFETEGFMQIKDIHGYIGHEKIYIKGEWTHKYYWMEIGLSLRLFTSQIQPNLYLQYYRGYGEFLINYNEKTEALRAGFILNI